MHQVIDRSEKQPEGLPLHTYLSSPMQWLQILMNVRIDGSECFKFASRDIEAGVQCYDKEWIIF